MLHDKKIMILFGTILSVCILVITGCGKQATPITTEHNLIPSMPLQPEPKATTNVAPLTPPTPELLPPTKAPDNATATKPAKNHDTGKKIRESSIYSSENPNELDFDVENLTGKPIYVTCFTYQRRRPFERWHWLKSPIYEILPGHSVTIDIDTVPDKHDRNFVFGYLGVMDSKLEAEESVFELLHDSKKLDLDLLHALKGKKVTIQVERYGMKGDFLDYDFVKKDSEATEPEDSLEFAVENQTGKPVCAVGFIYEKKAKGSWIGATEEKDDMTVWRYERTNVIKLPPGQTGIIKVDHIATSRDRGYVRGYLGVFDEAHENQAYNAVYELLDSSNKLNLGELARLTGKKVVLEVQNYGIMQESVNYVVKPVKKIDFTSINQPKPKAP